MRERREVVAALGIEPQAAHLSAAVHLVQRLHLALSPGRAQTQTLNGADVHRAGP